MKRERAAGELEAKYMKQMEALRDEMRKNEDEIRDKNKIIAKLKQDRMTLFAKKITKILDPLYCSDRAKKEGVKCIKCYWNNWSSQQSLDILRQDNDFWRLGLKIEELQQNIKENHEAMVMAQEEIDGRISSECELRRACFHLEADKVRIQKQAEEDIAKNFEATEARIQEEVVKFNNYVEEAEEEHAR